MKRALVLLCLAETLATTASAAPGGMPFVDLSSSTNCHFVIANGTPKIYNGHPTMTACETPDHLITVWTYEHAGQCGPAAESLDGGLTWRRIDGRFPDGWKNAINCPSIYCLKGSDGKRRLWVWANALGERELKSMMPSVMSEDDGKTWRMMPPLGEKFRCVMAFTSVVQLPDGAHFATFHRSQKALDSGWQDVSPHEVAGSFSTDGGFTWSDPFVIASDSKGDEWYCEPCVFLSPDGTELCCLLREQHHGPSRMCFSKDFGKTWSKPVPTSSGLSGHRHVAQFLPDGRIAVALRSWYQPPENPHRDPHFGCWIGSYSSMRAGSDAGAMMVKMLESKPGKNWGTWDTGYPAFAINGAGEIVAATYVHYRPDENRHSIVGVRFHPSTDLPMREEKGGSASSVGIASPHIKAKIGDCDRYAALNPHFPKAFAFLKRTDLADLRPGRYEIDGSNCWAMVQEAKLTPFADGAKVEAHRAYIDIQAPITGEETIGEVTMDEKRRALPFDEERDFVLFDAPSRPVTLKPGEFAIYFPPDGAHAPGHSLLCERTIRKLVIKVKNEK